MKKGEMKKDIKIYKTKSGVEYVTFADVKKQMFARPGFKKAYDALAPKYALIRAMLDARKLPHKSYT